MRKVNCDVESIELDNNANQDAYSSIQDAESFYFEYMNNRGTSKSTYIKAIEDKQKELKKEQDKLKTIKDPRRVREINNNIKKLASEIKLDSKVLETWGDKSRLLIDIQDQIMKQFTLYASQNMYEVNPYAMFPSIKAWLQDRLNNSFEFFHQLHPKELAIVKGALKDAFRKANQFANKQEKLGYFAKTWRNPAHAMFLTDPTGLAYDIVKTISELPEKVATEVNRRVRLIDEAYDPIYKHFSDKLMLDETEVSKQTKLAEEAVNQILDAELAYMIPADYMEADKEEQDKIISIVTNAVNTKLHARGTIHDYGEGDNRVPYVMILQDTPVDGRIEHKVYEIPHRKNENGQIILIKPTHKRLWREYYQSDKRHLAARTSVKDGSVITGRFTEGWRKAYDWAIDTANYHDDTATEYKVPQYHYKEHNFEYDISVVHRAAYKTREILLEYYDFIKPLLEKETDDVKTVTNKLLKMANVTADSGDIIKAKQLQEILKEITNSTGLNTNFSVIGGEIYHGEMSFNKKINHVPHLFHDTPRILGHKLAVVGLNRKLENKNHDFNTAADDEVLKLRKEIKDIEADIIWHQNTLDLYEGKIDIQDIDLSDSNGALNIIDGQKYSKSRSNMMVPIKILDPDTGLYMHEGRRMDRGIYREYFDTMYRGILNTEIKILLTNASLVLDPVHPTYLIDHFKSANGRIDTRGGFLGVDRSFTDRVNKAFKDVPICKHLVFSQEQVMRQVRLINSISSASYLQLGSPFTNNFQRLQMGVNSSFRIAHKAEDYVNGKGIYNETHAKIARDAAEKNGVTDLLVALADSLTAHIDGEGGPMSLFDAALIRLDQASFVQAITGTRWESVIYAAMDRMGMEGDEANNLKKLANGTWEMLHGLSSDDISVKEKRKILKEGNKKVWSKAVGGYVGWALKGGIVKAIANKFGMSWTGSFYEKFFTMTGSETTQRVEAFVAGALKYMDDGYITPPADITGDKVIEWLLEQPGAIEAGWLSVNNTMFNITLGNLPAAFKGISGTMGMKFKVFMYNQLVQETKLMKNYTYIKENYTENEQKALLYKFTKYLSVVLDAAPIVNMFRGPMRKKLINKYNTKYAGKAEKYDLSDQEEQYARMMLVKANIAAFSTFGMEIEILRIIYNTMAKFGGYRMTQGMVRGGSSVFWSLFFMALKIPGAIMAGDVDEDEKLLDDIMFNIMPFYMNILYKTAFTSQTAGEAASEIGGIWVKPYMGLMEGAYDAIDSVFD